jgi:hypothetical protein
MKKLLPLILIVIVFYSCTKSDTTPPPTNLQISVSNISGYVQGATVYLFVSKADWDNAVYNGANTYVASGITNSNGEVTFKNLNATTTYYWVANDGCQNSVNDSISTTTALFANINNASIAVIESTEAITVKNTNSVFPINVTLNGVLLGSINAGVNATISQYASVGGSYFISSYDPDDLQTQTATISPDVCGGTFAVTANP